MLINLLGIAFGGALGALARFFTSSGVEHIFKNRNFPAGILVCNLLGGLVIGILAGVMLKKMQLSEWWRYFLVVGLCGGFTTFSSFSLDNLLLLRQGLVTLAFGNMILSVFGSLFMTYIGFALVSI